MLLTFFKLVFNESGIIIGKVRHKGKQATTTKIIKKNLIFIDFHNSARFLQFGKDITHLKTQLSAITN